MTRKNFQLEKKLGSIIRIEKTDEKCKTNWKETVWENDDKKHWNKEKLKYTFISVNGVKSH